MGIFYIVSGTGTVRLRKGTQPVRAGDMIMHPPNEAHQISNEGPEVLLYFIIADEPPLDFCEYPDSNKAKLIWREGFLRPLVAGYWDGEE